LIFHFIEYPELSNVDIDFDSSKSLEEQKSAALNPIREACKTRLKSTKDQQRDQKKTTKDKHKHKGSEFYDPRVENGTSEEETPARPKSLADDFDTSKLSGSISVAGRSRKVRFTDDIGSHEGTIKERKADKVIPKTKGSTLDEQKMEKPIIRDSKNKSTSDNRSLGSKSSTITKLGSSRTSRKRKQDQKVESERRVEARTTTDKFSPLEIEEALGSHRSRKKLQTAEKTDATKKKSNVGLTRKRKNEDESEHNRKSSELEEKMNVPKKKSNDALSTKRMKEDELEPDRKSTKLKAADERRTDKPAPAKTSKDADRTTAKRSSKSMDKVSEKHNSKGKPGSKYPEKSKERNEKRESQQRSHKKSQESSNGGVLADVTSKARKKKSTSSTLDRSFATQETNGTHTRHRRRKKSAVTTRPSSRASLTLKPSFFDEDSINFN
jgi:hypothetical protein